MKKDKKYEYEFICSDTDKQLYEKFLLIKDNDIKEYIELKELFNVVKNDTDCNKYDN